MKSKRKEEMYISQKTNKEILKDYVLIAKIEKIVCTSRKAEL